MAEGSDIRISEAARQLSREMAYSINTQLYNWPSPYDDGLDVGPIEWVYNQRTSTHTAYNHASGQQASVTDEAMVDLPGTRNLIEQRLRTQGTEFPAAYGRFGASREDWKGTWGSLGEAALKCTKDAKCKCKECWE